MQHPLLIAREAITHARCEVQATDPEYKIDTLDRAVTHLNDALRHLDHFIDKKLDQ